MPEAMQLGALASTTLRNAAQHMLKCSRFPMKASARTAHSVICQVCRVRRNQGLHLKNSGMHYSCDGDNAPRMLA